MHIEGNTLKVEYKEYELTPSLRMLILYKKPRHQHYTSDDYSVYKTIAAQTRVRAYPNKGTGSARPCSTWKWKHMLLASRLLLIKVVIAMRVKAILRGCPQTRVNSDYVLNFYYDAYTMEVDMHDVHYFCVFLVYKIKAYSRIKHWERNYLISNWSDGKEAKYKGICFLPDKKTLRIHGGGSVGSDDAFGFRAWRKTNPCEENRFQVICVEYVKNPKSSYSSLWVNGSYVTNFDSTASFGSDQRLTLGNIPNVPFLGIIAAMEISTGITADIGSVFGE